MRDRGAQPHKIREGDLLAYLDGGASPEVSAHIAGCPSCSADVEALRRADALLHAALHRADCPTADDLLQYQAGLLSRAEQRRIKRHVAGCADCSAELEQLALAPAPQPAPAARLAGPRKALRSILAVLLKPPAQQAPALRGGARRQSEYQAEGYLIRLQIVPPLAGEQIWQIEGMLDRREPDLPSLEGAAVQLLRDETPVADDRLDDLGYFALERIGPGRYTLRIDGDGLRILVEDLLIS